MFSVHQRDETGKKRFLFFNRNIDVLSLVFEIQQVSFPKRDDSTDIPRERSYINISMKDVLYINDQRGCLLLSLSFGKVCQASSTDNGSTAFTLFLYPVGFMILINPQPQSPVRPEYKKRECLLNQHQQSAIYSLLYNKLIHLPIYPPSASITFVIWLTVACSTCLKHSFRK